MDVTGDPGDLAVVNLTPVGATSTGHGWLSSSDNDDAEVSNVNYRTGSVDPNVAVAEIGTDGQVCFHNSPFASVHIVADQLATISADATSAVTPQRLIDTRHGEPDALAVTDNGRVVAAHGAQLLVRERDGSITPIDLPAGSDVSRAWIGPDQIAVAWGTDGGAEVDTVTGEVVSQLTHQTNGVWSRTLTQPDNYREQPGRPHNSLGIGLLVRSATVLPTVEGAGCFETVYLDAGPSWTIAQPAECSASVDEIAPLATGGYLVTLRPPETVGRTIYPDALHSDGTVESIASVDSGNAGIDTQPTPDGLTILEIDGDAATVRHRVLP